MGEESMKHLRITSITQWPAAIAAALLTPSLAYAHTGVGGTSGVVDGLLHPLTGIDHMAAMIAVGLWAIQCGGRAVWAVPLSFVTVMASSSLIGAAGIALPFVEPGIAASVLILGLLIVAAIRLPLAASMALVGLFALFHGYAHGTEMPETAAGAAYGIGFVLSTGLLHALGIVVGLAARNLAAPELIRYAGGATTAFGVYLVIA